MEIVIRNEHPGDEDAIGRVTEAAFAGNPYSIGAEKFILTALRLANALTVSLAALDGDSIVGHVALSPVTVSSGATGWYGLGPISVLPEYQRSGVGALLMREALAELQHKGAAGVVVLGDPAYYSRFGFVANSPLVLPGHPAQYFQALSFNGDIPAGSVRYHDAFLTPPG